MNALNPEVTSFLDDLDHPLRAEIEELRSIILNSADELSENIKWNGPNYVHQKDDRITMKIQPPKQIQLIFHQGAKKLEQPVDRLIKTDSKLLVWKENDRALISFKKLSEIESAAKELKEIIQKWIVASK